MTSKTLSCNKIIQVSFKVIQLNDFELDCHFLWRKNASKYLRVLEN